MAILEDLERGYLIREELVDIAAVEISRDFRDQGEHFFLCHESTSQPRTTEAGQDAKMRIASQANALRFEHGFRRVS